MAKKSEAARPEFGKDGDPDVNISITTRELAHMIRFANMNFDELEESDFDRPLGESTGAGVIFGTTGGVIEAAVRTAYEIQTKKRFRNSTSPNCADWRGIRSATIDFDGVPVKNRHRTRLGNARRLVEEIRAGRSPYHAIEIMACPGGCINGGGQPLSPGQRRASETACRGPLRRRRRQTAAQVARESRHSGTLRRVPRRTLRTAFARTAPHPLLRPQTGRGTQEIRRYGKICLSQRRIDEIKNVCRKYGNDPGELINILHGVQDTLGYLPKEVQELIALELGISAARVYGVVSFYSFFTMKPKGKYPISVCMGTACYVRGGEKVLDEFRRQLGIEVGGTTPRRALLARFAAVRGCLRTRSVVIGPRVYGRLKVTDVKGILDEIQALEKRDLTTRYYVK